MTTLRPYQTAALDRLDASLAAGKRSPLIVAPTGSGKTVLAAEIIRRRGGNCLFLAPRRELVHQTCRKLDDVGVPYGVLLAGDDRLNLYRPVQVASIDTVFARVVRRERVVLPDFGLIVVDEAHLSITKPRLGLLARWPDAIRVGLTATPIRKDGRALGMVYDDLIEVATPAELIVQDFLVPARYFSVSEPDLSRVTTVAGDFHQGQLAAAMNQARLVGDVVDHWLDARGRAAHRRVRDLDRTLGRAGRAVPLARRCRRARRRRHAPGRTRRPVQSIPLGRDAGAHQLLPRVLRVRPARARLHRAGAADEEPDAVPADARPRSTSGRG